ncbi:hypothetical protein NIES21_61200 (plasmid) [Anabaenopsis circularis NIES-21]|uniref:Uncharacterized protein n=1 Tax=Anabaenopsis circularis NIES-21 TaxID=1085406 RepID=A0A1Z4GS02_9CYAN|nr:hypothetical protein NIES21_61200 [Anabaenopsis circularis NIES-21]
MPIKQSKEAPDYYRKAFELISGSLPNRRWRQIRNELERSGVVINLKSVQFYARLKLSYPRTVLTKSSIKTLERFQLRHQDRQEFLGQELLNILREIKPTVSDRMLINSFYKARLSFGRQNIYSFEEASKVVFFTAISRNKV